MKFKTLIPPTSAVLALAGLCGAQQPDSAVREQLLLDRIAKLEERIAVLESRLGSPAPVAAPAQAAASAAQAAASDGQVSEAPATAGLSGTTVNFFFDGYYSWNTNRPVGRVNLLHAYDVSHNSFSINQAGTVIERLPDLAAGRRWGYRLDLMYGQATETLQGGAQNEPRPQVYRPLFQAYGTYILPVGKGLTADFGKWASALGAEGNYTKDQINYSRSYFFNLLPFYHTGFRASYPVNDNLSIAYWLVNGGNQTEDFNGGKSQNFQAVIKPAKNVVWTMQYYFGQEHRDLVPDLNPGAPTIASQPGLSITPVSPRPDGLFHVIDTYVSYNASSRLMLAGEFAYVINRAYANASPLRVIGGAAYLRYQITPRVYFGQRYERLNDHGGLFSGVSQNLNDLTSTLGFRVTNGVETRAEFRRDFSNVPFFLPSNPGELKKDQNIFTLGLLWWFGGKEGSW